MRRRITLPDQPSPAPLVPPPCTGWLDPLLALLLRYLMHIASCYEQSAGSAPVPDAELRAALVPAGARDAGPLPHEGGAARLFPAADVQVGVCGEGGGAGGC